MNNKNSILCFELYGKNINRNSYFESTIDINKLNNEVLNKQLKIRKKQYDEIFTEKRGIIENFNSIILYSHLKNLFLNYTNNIFKLNQIFSKNFKIIFFDANNELKEILKLERAIFIQKKIDNISDDLHINFHHFLNNNLSPEIVIYNNLVKKGL